MLNLKATFIYHFFVQQRNNILIKVEEMPSIQRVVATYNRYRNVLYHPGSSLFQEDYIPVNESWQHPFVNWNNILKYSTRLDIYVNVLIKRTWDIMISLLVIILLLSWIMPLFAFFILIESSGPVFFLQKRMGYRGKEFTCIKFRSMYVNDQCDLKPVEENDCRVTPFGKVLRKFHLDELPQFLNVLGGSMTIVGPRPHMISENNYYEDVIENYTFRYKVKPGITGLGQVNNRINMSNKIKMECRIFWDVLYIKNWSQYLDVWIMYRTFFICLRGGKLV